MVATGLAEARLRLSGTYHAPFRILGQLADRTLLHGIAEGSLADLLDRLAASVLAERSRAAAPADPRRPRWLRPCAGGADEQQTGRIHIGPRHRRGAEWRALRHGREIDEALLGHLEDID
jgi:hypothetical protein